MDDTEVPGHRDRLDFVSAYEIDRLTLLVAYNNRDNIQRNCG